MENIVTGKRYYSSFNKSSKYPYMKMVNEKDSSQNTTNVHIIARRHISSGLPTNVIIINTVLGLAITQDELNLLTSIKPVELILSNASKQVRLAIQIIVGKVRTTIPYNIRIAGVYGFTNTKTGDYYVKSSINLAARNLLYTCKSG